MRKRLAALLPPAAVFLASATVFLPAIQGGFVWDDEALLLQNQRFRGLGTEQLRWMFTAMPAGPYQPLAWLSYAVDYLIGGMNPAAFHFSNVLLHAANAAIFYLLAKRLLAEALEPKDAQALAWSAGAAALLFSLHPLRVESAAWISERRGLLCGSFYLLSVLWYIEGRRAASIAACALALLSKATAMTLPVTLLLLDVYPLERLRLGARRLLAEKLPYAALAAAAAIAAYVGQANAGAMEYQSLGLLARIGHATYGLMFYLGKTLLPVSLSPLYEMPPGAVGMTAAFALSAAAAAAITAALVAVRRAWPAGLTAWAFYAASLAPTSGLVSYGMQAAADRYSYLACLAWPLLAGAALYKALLRPRMRGWGMGFAAAALVTLSLLTRSQLGVWKNERTAWERALQVDARASVARVQLGRALLREKRLDEAIVHFERAVALNPAYAHAHYSLGDALVKKRELRTAAVHLQRAIALNPGYAPAEALNNIGVALASEDREQALAYFRRAVDAEPRFSEARCNLAVLLAAQGQRGEAERHLREILKENPGHERSRRELAKLR